jgi:pimeloyl-ACP methyl ester carboxylesterase
MKPRQHRFLSLGPNGFHRIAYTEWGNPRNEHIVVCVHGLTRNSRDFDTLAEALADKCRVVCMDVAGRGDSDWLTHKEDYGFPLYKSDAAALIAHITNPATQGGGLFQYLWKKPAFRIDWLGTSMGGLIGMSLAAKRNSPIRRLVLNDVGPRIPWSGLMRLKNSHVRSPSTRFADLDEAEAHLRTTCASFGPLQDRQWRSVTVNSVRRSPDGTYALAYDPAIVTAMRQNAHKGAEFGVDFLMGVDLWPVWDAVRCPTLVLRGAASEVLLPSTVAQMRERGPRATVAEFAGIGHAPWLMRADEIKVVRDFILAREPAVAAAPEGVPARAY